MLDIHGNSKTYGAVIWLNRIQLNISARELDNFTDWSGHHSDSEYMPNEFLVVLLGLTLFHFHIQMQAMREIVRMSEDINEAESYLNQQKIDIISR